MAKLTVMRGLPASGKTTRAYSLVARGASRVSRDELRRSLFNVQDKARLDPVKESVITRVEKDMVFALLATGQDVVVDDMNLRNEYIKSWDLLAQQFDAEFQIVDLTDVPLYVLINRNLNRNDGVPQQLVNELYQRYVKGKPHPLPYERKQLKDNVVGAPYVRPDYKPKAIIVDIDGTVALHANRSPYDYSLVSTDEPNLPIVQLVKDWAHQNPSGIILFTSGRPDSCRDETEKWLGRTFLGLVRWNWDLLMRRAEDKRNDSVVKLELFDKYIREDYRVEFVLDDRNRVVDMWRSIGLTCLQVAPGNF